MTAAARWRRLVRARLAEVDRLSPARGPDTADFWDARARRFAARLPVAGARDPFLSRVRRAVGRSSTVLDVGAGAGRFALALAPKVAEVVAVDPSGQMLAHLRRQSRRLGVANVTALQGRWQDVDPPVVDVGICSYVLPIVVDAAGFLRKLDAACRRQVFVYLGAVSTDAVFDPFWRHFHGAVRRPGPTYLDALALLRELGMAPHVDVVEAPVLARFRRLADAVDDYRDNLLLPDTSEIRRELRDLLGAWLVKDDGGLRAPLRSLPAAVISWRPSVVSS